MKAFNDIRDASGEARSVEWGQMAEEADAQLRNGNYAMALKRYEAVVKVS